MNVHLVTLVGPDLAGNMVELIVIVTDFNQELVRVRASHYGVFGSNFRDGAGN